MKTGLFTLFLCTALLILSGCSKDSSAPSSAPSKAEAVAHEADLLKLTLTPDAQKRLGIRITRIAQDSIASRRETSGEIVVPSVNGGVPTNSLSNLAQIGLSQAAADGEVDRTRAQVRLARIALNRAETLVREEAGSVRARDEARAALATAEAQASAAVAQRRLLGPAVARLDAQPSLWVRVSVFGSDVVAVRHSAAAEVRPLGQNGAVRRAYPVKAPPSANLASATVDIYYTIDNRDRAWRVGQRVAVSLPLAGGTQAGLSIPTSAIVRDMYGGEWVYQRTAPDTYVRQRIEVAATQGNVALLARGLAPGAEIVSVGAMELFGTEFGVAH